MDLSICIVNWNTRELLRQCLHSLPAAVGSLVAEVIVVDNASADGSAQMVREEFPGVQLIANRENRFYAAANNQALRAARGSCCLLLNSDIVAPPGSLQTLVQWLAGRNRVGAVAPRLVYPDGTLQRSCRTFPGPEVVVYECLGLSRLFPRSRVFGKYRMGWWEYDEERAVDQPMASALLVRTAALEQVGLFDEQFPMFFNDVDLCRRLWDAGWEIWFTPAVTLMHHHGGSTRLVKRSMIAQSGRSFLAYYHKHYRGKISWPSYWTAVTLLRMAYAVRLALAGRQTPEQP